MFQTPRRRIAPGTAQAPGDRRWAQDPSWAATGIRAAEAFHKAASSISDSDSTGTSCMCPAVLNAAMRLLKGISGIPDEDESDDG